MLLCPLGLTNINLIFEYLQLIIFCSFLISNFEIEEMAEAELNLFCHLSMFMVSTIWYQPFSP